MGGYYVDLWGEVCKKIDLSDWSDFEPWEYWQNEFEWRACGTDIQEQDMIGFRDNVCVERPNGEDTYHRGVRFIIARVARIDGDRIYLEVAHSEGEEPIDPSSKIRRRMQWLTQFGVVRWPRNHGPTQHLTDKQIQRSKEIKAEREKKAQKAGGTGSSGGGTSIRREFTENARSISKRKKPVPKKQPRPGL